MKRIVLSVFLTAVVLLAAHAQFAGGTGTEADPYQITTADHLNAVRDNLASHFIMMNDIDLTEAGYALWQPIGKADDGTVSNFAGTFDGQGYVISGINIVQTTRFASLFAIMSDAIISNLGLKGRVSSTEDGVGLLVGETLGTTEILYCFGEGSVESSGVGGSRGAGVLTGRVSTQSRVIGCYSKGSVIAPELDFVGGLIARMTNRGVSLFDCYSEAIVTGANNVGGITGRIYSETASPVNAAFLYATGKVVGKNFVGGIAGDLYDAWAASLIAANPSITATNADGIVARVAPLADGRTIMELEYIYGLETTEVKVGTTDKAIENDDTGVDGKTITLTDLTTDFFDEGGWDLETTWTVAGESGLPTLQWQESMQSNIQKVQAGVPFTVYMQGQMLHIANIEAGADIALYNMSGQLIKEQQSAGTSDVIILTQPGLYMVKVANQAAKVICE